MLHNDYNYYYQLYFQDEANALMIGIKDLHDYILFYIIIILTIVSYFVLFVTLNYNLNIIVKELNHNSNLEIIWTIVPGIILLFIALPSFKLLYYSDEILNPLITLKVEGNQWFWNYSLNDYIGLNIEFTSYPKFDLENNEPKLLSVDNIIYLPVNIPIRVLVTSTDVIHSWAVPSLAMKIDSIPGRINHGLVHILRPGIFYGQCSELCGLGHSIMPIVIIGTNNYEYLSWLISFFDVNIYNLINIFKNI